jgi:hypothetical protein
MNRTSRLLAFLLVAVLIGVGVYVAYRTGFDTGAAVASADTGADGGERVIVTRPYGWHGGFGFFPFFLFFPFFFILLFALFRPWRWGGRGWHEGPGGYGSPRERMEERMTEWHRRAHNEGDEDSPRS